MQDCYCFSGLIDISIIIGIAYALCKSPSAGGLFVRVVRVLVIIIHRNARLLIFLDDNILDRSRLNHILIVDRYRVDNRTRYDIGVVAEARAVCPAAARVLHHRVLNLRIIILRICKVRLNAYSAAVLLINSLGSVVVAVVENYNIADSRHWNKAVMIGQVIISLNDVILSAVCAVD